MAFFKSTPAKLMALLNDAVAILTQVGETHWSAWLADCHTQIAADAKSGSNHLLTAFGGMGSFNDLWLCQINGHRVLPADESQINAKLDHLRLRMYDLAQQIQKPGNHGAI
jgi:hypothetical protein